MRRAIIAVSVIFAMVGFPAAAATKAGGPCRKLGAVTQVGKVRFVCVQRGGKLVWKKTGLAPIARPVAPTATPTPTQPVEAYSAPSIAGQPSTSCAITEVSVERQRWGNLAAAFPMPKDDLRRAGFMRAVLLPIDWADLPGQPNPVARAQADMDAYADWYESVSGSRLDVEWVAVNQWIRMPGVSTDYAIRQSNNSALGDAMAQAAVTRADAVVDFTNVDVVHFLLPLGQEFLGESVQGFPYTIAGGGLMTDEGKVSSFTVAGRFFDQAPRTYWSYWAHEMGHSLRLAHVGSSREWSAMQGYELLGSQDGPYRSMGAWLRFLKGWLDVDEVYCQTLETLQPVTVMLASVDETTTGVKGVMVRLSDSRVLVIDARRITRFASVSGGSRNGVLAYIVDATLGNQEPWALPVYPAGRGTYRVPAAPPMVDAILYPGDKVITHGVSIAVLRSGQYDTVRIERV